MKLICVNGHTKRVAAYCHECKRGRRQIQRKEAPPGLESALRMRRRNVAKTEQNKKTARTLRARKTQTFFCQNGHEMNSARGSLLCLICAEYHPSPKPARKSTKIPKARKKRKK